MQQHLCSSSSFSTRHPSKQWHSERCPHLSHMTEARLDISHRWVEDRRGFGGRLSAHGKGDVCRRSRLSSVTARKLLIRLRIRSDFTDDDLYSPSDIGSQIDRPAVADGTIPVVCIQTTDPGAGGHASPFRNPIARCAARVAMIPARTESAASSRVLRAVSTSLARHP